MQVATHKSNKTYILDYPYMKNSEYNGSTEFEKAIRFLELGCNCGCSKKIPREDFAEAFLDPN